eukprot:356652-Chlamydomonas_euryale.AAC.3
MRASDALVIGTDARRSGRPYSPPSPPPLRAPAMAGSCGGVAGDCGDCRGLSSSILPGGMPRRDALVTEASMRRSMLSSLREWNACVERLCGWKQTCTEGMLKCGSDLQVETNRHAQRAG